jgi:hypothetical protein
MAEPRERYLDKYRDEIIMLIRDRRYTPVRIRKYLEDTYGLEVPKSTLSVFMKTLPPIEPVENVPPEAEHFLEQYEHYEVLKHGIDNVMDLAAHIYGRLNVLEEDSAKRHETPTQDIGRLVHVLDTVLQKHHDDMKTALQKIYDYVQERDMALQQRHNATEVTLQRIYDASPKQAHHDAVLSAIKAATQGLESPPDVRPAITALQESLAQQAKDITAIRRSVGPVWSMVRKHAPWMKAFFFTGLFWLAVILGTMWQYNLWRFLPWRLR